jgi:23S rRNA (adenine2030-N6)-methyltransferase
MQYRHSFHAGNFADVHKHVALLALIASLQRKAKGFFYLDTHGGGGLYDLRSEEARRGAEAQHGYERLAATTPRSAEIDAYLAAVARVRALTGAGTYPGSPLLAAASLREQDRATSIEFVSQESRHLQRSLDAIAALAPVATRVECGDGYERLVALMPPKERRALVLIDPPYEAADEYNRILAVLPEALRRFDSCVIAVWFPIKRQRDADLWLAKVTRLLEQPTLCAQLWLHPRDSAVALNGSGLLIVNPPWQTDVRLALWQEELRELLGGDGNSGSEVKWLVNERT